MMRALCVGECMLELRELDDRTFGLGFAGDTYNAAVYLRRLATELGVQLEVGYLSGLGEDAYSAAMRRAWADEGIADRSLLVHGRVPGLYAIHTSTDGEREFTYWRKDSAANVLFAGTDWIAALDADVIHISGVTLQLMTPASRSALVARLSELRRDDAVICFDTNYRPAGWASASEAATAMDDVSAVASIVLTSSDDERLLHGTCSPPENLARIAALGAMEVVLRDGADGAHVLADGTITHVAAAVVDDVVDTTAAGDSFAGAYLATRLDGASPPDAAAVGNAVAGEVIRHRGAIAPVGACLLESRDNT